MAMAAMMSVGAMGVNALAMETLRDDDGNIVAYVTTIYDVDDVDVGKDLLAQIPAECAFSSAQPTYNLNLRNLESADYSDTFSLMYNGGIGYSKPWTKSAQYCGMRFYDVNDMSKLTMYIYEVDSSGNRHQVLTWRPTSIDIGTTVVNMSSNKHYYMMLVNSASSTQSGHVVVTNDPESYGLHHG